MKNVLLVFFLLLIVSTLYAKNFWERTNFQGQSTGTLVINSEGDLVAGTRTQGVLRSEDDGESWLPVNEGLTKMYINQLIINKQNEINFENLNTFCNQRYVNLYCCGM